MANILDIVNTDPLFIGGDERSGTTYLRILLSRHPDIWISDESQFIIKLIRTFKKRTISKADELEQVLSLLYEEQKFRDWEIPRIQLIDVLNTILPTTLSGLVRAILRFDRDRRSPGARVLGIKKPSYTRNPLKLLKYFPEARFINIIRDGRAVFNSKKKAKHSETGQFFETDPMRAAEEWCTRAKIFDSFCRKHPSLGLQISYEEMIQNPDSSFKKIYRFIDVTEDIDVLNLDSVPEITLPEHRRLSHPNVSKAPMVSRIDAWRQELAPDEIRQYEVVAGATLKQKGYDLVCGKPRLSSTISYRFSYFGRHFGKRLKKSILGKRNS